MKYALQITLAALLAHIAASERLMGDLGNGEKIPIDISVDGHLVTVVAGQPDPPQSFFIPTINMYDFDAKREARKLVGGNGKAVCYIKGLKVEFDQVEKFFTDFKSNDNHVTTHVLEEWNDPGAKIAPEDLEQTVGAKIAKFCSGYQVFWMKLGRKNLRKVSHRVKRQWTGSLGGGYKGSTGFSGNAGVNYNKKPWKFNGKLTFSEKEGFGVSAGVTFNF